MHLSEIAFHINESRFGKFLIKATILFLLQTRVCAKCGSMLGIHLEQLHGGSLHMNDNDSTGLGSARKWLCTVCNSPDNVSLLAVPYVFQYLVAELAAMSIKVTLDVQ